MTGLTDAPADLPARLGHVYWIGGATDSGKTSVARGLATRRDIQTYHLDLFDGQEPPGHWARRDPTRHPAMSATRVDDPDWMWVDTTPERLVEAWLRTAPERFSLAIEDLLALPTQPPIVAEGYGFMPDLVEPLLQSHQHAIWLISTEEFKRASYARRGKGTFADTTDPDRARRNHVGRDIVLAEVNRQQAIQLGLTAVDVDGKLGLDGIVDLVVEHFGWGD
jgi:hypothetical protein